MKKLLLPLMVALAFMVGMPSIGIGQISLASLELGTTSYSSNTTGAATFTTFATGISAAPVLSLTLTQQAQAGGTGYVSSKAWSTSTINTAFYWQFTIAAASGYNITSISSIAFKTTRSASGPATAELRSDADAYASTLSSTVSVPSTAGTITFSSIGLTNKSSVTFRVYGYAASGTGTWRFGDGAASSPEIDIQGTVAATTPTLTAYTLLSSLSNTSGTASTGVAFTAAGTNLSTTITATPQSGWEISTASGSGYSTSAITGVTTGTTLYVRNAATLAAGTYNTTTCVVLSGGGAASSVNVTTSASGNTVSAAPSPTLTAYVLLSSLSNTIGTASTGVAFTAAGTNLSTTITATPQSGWEISTASGSGYSTSAITGVATGTTLYVRNASTLAVGTYNSTTCVVLSGGGAASSANVTTSSSGNAVNAAPALSAVTLSSALSNNFGTASTGVSFTASGTNLSTTITATPQSGWEISTDNSSFGSSAITGVASGTTLYVRNAASLAVGSYNTTTCVVLSGGGAASSVNVTTSASGNIVSAAATPTLTAVTLGSALSSTYGSASTGVSFTAAGSNLTTTIIVSPQTGYEIATTLGGTYQGTAITGVASGTTLYVRVASSVNAGTYNSAICVVLSDGGAASSANVTTSASGNTVSQLSQTITFGALSSVSSTGTADYSPGATSPTSGINAITYTSSNTAVATIVSGNIHIVAAGTTTITAAQAGSTNYSAATSVPQSLTVVAPPVITATSWTVTSTAGSPYLIALYSNTGTPSGVTGFTFTASGLSTNGSVLITPPSGFEVCLTATGTFTPTLTVTASGTSITTTAVYVRLSAADAVGTYGGSSNNLTLTTTNVVTTTVNVLTTTSKVSSTVDNVPLLALDFTSISSTNNAWGATTFTSSSTAGYSATNGTILSNVGTLPTGISAASVSRPSAFVVTAGTPAGGGYGSNNFNITASTEAAAVAASNYFNFNVSTSANYSTSFQTIPSYVIRRSGSGATTGQWAYQITYADGSVYPASSGANVGTATGQYNLIGSAVSFWNNGNAAAITTAAAAPYNPQPAIDLSGISALQNVPGGATVTFRFAVYGATASTGTFYIFSGYVHAGASAITNGTGLADFSILGRVQKSIIGTSPATTSGSPLTLSYIESAGPSSTQDITLTSAYLADVVASGSGATATEITNGGSGSFTVYAPTNFEIYNTTSGLYQSSATVNYTAGVITSTTSNASSGILTVRLKSGLTAASSPFTGSLYVGGTNATTALSPTANSANGIVYLSGTVIPHVANITLTQGATALVNGSGTYSFGRVAVNTSSSAITFTITNTGNNSFTFGNATSSNSAFSVNKSGTTSIGVGSVTPTTTTFTITYSPTVTPVTLESSTITVTGTDPNGGSYSYTYSVTGTSVNAGPQLNVQQSGSDVTTYNFGSQVSGISGTSPVTFTLQSIGTQTVTLSGSPKVTISGTNSSDFSISQPSASSLVVGATSTFTVTFNPSGFGTRTATLSIASNDASSPYTIDLTGSGTATSTSDIIANASFANPTSIPYISYTTASSLTTSNAVGVQGFTIRDNGSSLSNVDNLSTALNAITFSTGGSTAIKTAALFDGSTNIKEVSVNGATSFSFSGLSLTAASAGTKNFTLYVTFQSTQTDQSQLVFTVTSATAASTGSAFATSNAGSAVSSSAIGDNTIAVTATALAYGQQPTSALVNVAMSPSVTVKAVDANGNLDTHEALGSVSIVSTANNGTLSGTPLTATLTSGVATFASVVHTVNGLNLQLTASATTIPSLGFIISNSFNITTTLAAWNFTAVQDGTESGSAVTNLTTVSAISYGNPLTTVSTFISNSNSSTGYSGASGTYNAGNAAAVGSLNTSTSAYFQFTLTPARTYHVGVTGISFASYSTVTGPQAYAIYSSKDNYASAIATGTLNNTSSWLANSSSTFSNIGAVSTAVTYRIYGYNGSGAASGVNWRIDDISVYGSVEADQTPVLIAYSDFAQTNQITSLATQFTEVNGVASASQIYYLTADNLAPNATAVVTVTPPNGYVFSTTSNGTYSSSPINLNSGILGDLVGEPVAIYVKLASTSTSNGNYNGTITNTINNPSSYVVTTTAGTPVNAPLTVTGLKSQDYYNLGSGNVDNVLNWGVNTDGGGAHPVDFISAGQTFRVYNGTAVTLTGTSWSVSGTGSTILVGNGTKVVTLTVPATSTISGALTLANNSTLKLLNTTISHTYTSVASGSTIEYAQGSAFTIPQFTYGNLVLSGAGTKTFASSTTISGNLTFNGVRYEGATTFLTQSVGGNITYTGAVNSTVDANTMTLSMTGATGTTQTITGDGLGDIRWLFLKTNNASTVKLTKTGLSNINLKVGNATSGGLTLVASSILDLNGNDLTFANVSGVGAANLSTNGTISTTTTSNINLFKSNTVSLGTLNLTSSSNSLGSLTVNHTGSSNATLTIGSAINITGSLNVTAGTLTTGGLITLKSTSITNSAVVGQVGGTISGNVAVERFIPAGYRGYRDLAPQVSGAGTIYDTWQEGGSFTSGKGLFITGPAATNALLSAYAGGQPSPSSAGLDYSINGVASAFTYNNATGSFNWNYGGTGTNTYTAGAVAYGIANTKVALDPFTGYRVLVRGDRSFNLATTPIVNYYNYGLRMVNSTVLRATGKIVSGTVTYNTTNASGTTADGSAISSTSVALNSNVNGFSMVANPYVCPVQWGTGTVSNSATTTVYGASSNVNGSYWYLDPTSTAVGRYLAFNALTGSSVVRTASNGDTAYNSTSSLGYIQAGQAVFVQTFAANPVVVFKETAKGASSPKAAIFGTSAPLSKLYVGLLKKDSVGTYSRVDAAAIAFSSNFGNAAYGPQDALKFTNSNDNLSISDKGKSLSIDGRLPATATDVLPLSISKVSGTDYQLVVDASNYTSNGFAPYLVDSYRGTITSIGTSSTTVNFTVDANLASTYASRFSIAFKPTTLAVNSIIASAKLTNKTATISWNTVGEKGVSRFEVEKSIDAKAFTKISQTSAKNTATASYTTTDNNVVSTTSYYRIKAISEVGTVSYSNLVQLTVNSKQFSIYPNPLVGKTLNVSYGNIAAGKYTVTISNVLGQKVQEVAITHAGGTSSHPITVNNTLAAGTYTVTIRETASGLLVHQTNLSVN